MTHVRRHFMAGESNGLRRIRDPAFDLAVWRRHASDEVRRFALHTPPELLPNVTFECGNAYAIPHLVRAALVDDSADGYEFAEDVRRLAHAFEWASGAKRFRVRIERVTDDGCRKFHVDRVRYRLACTYRGPATEWLPEHAADRAALGTENARIVRSWNAVRRAPRFAVLLLKGELAAEENLGIVHRSPPVRRIEDARLVVIIDDADVAYR